MNITLVMPLLSGAIGAASVNSPVFWLNALNLAAISLMSLRMTRCTVTPRIVDRVR